MSYFKLKKIKEHLHQYTDRMETENTNSAAREITLKEEENILLIRMSGFR